MDVFSEGGAGVGLGCVEEDVDCWKGEFEDLTGHEPCVSVGGDGSEDGVEEDVCIGQPG